MNPELERIMSQVNAQRAQQPPAPAAPPAPAPQYAPAVPHAPAAQYATQPQPQPASLADPAVRDFSQGPPAVPWVALTATWVLDRLTHSGTRSGGCMYKALCTCTHSSTPDVTAGGQYVYLFTYDPRAFAEEDVAKNRRALHSVQDLIVAACGLPALAPNAPEQAKTEWSAEVERTKVVLMQASAETGSLGLPFRSQQTPRTTRNGKTVTNIAFFPGV